MAVLKIKKAAKKIDKIERKFSIIEVLLIKKKTIETTTIEVILVTPKCKLELVSNINPPTIKNNKDS